jgi:micrococcal nuclease
MLNKLDKNATQTTAGAGRSARIGAAVAPSARTAAPATPTTVRSITSEKLAEKLYFYQAVVRSVYDGDTMTVDIDLGMHNWIHGEKLRLLRINAPEVRGRSRKKGEAARDYLRGLVDGKVIVLETYKDDKEKYGRYLAEVWMQQENERWINVNDAMVKAGHAEYKEY